MIFDGAAFIDAASQRPQHLRFDFFGRQIRVFDLVKYRVSPTNLCAMVTGIVESVHEDGTVSVQTCCCVWPPIPGPSRWVAAAEELVVISSLSHVSGSRGRSFVRRPVVLTGWLSRDVHSPHQLGPPLVIFRAAVFKQQTADLDLEMQLDELGHYILKALKEWPTPVKQPGLVTGLILDNGIEQALLVVEDPERFRNVVCRAEEFIICLTSIATRLQASRRGQWARMRAEAPVGA